MKDSVAVIVAVLALAGLGVFVIFLTQRTDSPEPTWGRYVYLFGAIEAIAFAAAGFLFGREVNRQRADKAEQRADNAEQRASTADKQATRGSDLAEAIRSKAASLAGAKAGAYGGLGAGSAAAATKADLEELADFATRLFPPR
jgi:hypothetical protein